jgi:hypothetical protein
MVTKEATAPEVGLSWLIVGVRRTVNGEPALGTPFTVTTTLPAPVVPVGTVATMEVSLQLVIEAAVVVPGKVTVLVPCDEPKLVPVMVTEAPTAAVAGERFEIAGVMVKSKPLVVTPSVVTVTLPVVAPVGTVTPIEVLIQPLLLMVAEVPLNDTVPCVVPKFWPVIVTEEPGSP